MIADVAFDLPLPRTFSYAVPQGWTVATGQRVQAPLARAERVGLIVALREGETGRLKPLLRVIDREPLLDPASVDLARWIAAESLTSFGSTCLALVPPAAGAPAGAGDPARAGRRKVIAAAPAAPRAETPVPSIEVLDRPRHPGVPDRSTPCLLLGAGREQRLLDAIAERATALVLTPDLDAAARWAQRLGRLGAVARLDSGVSDGERARGWDDLARGRVRLAVGTRSALLAPLPGGAVVGLVDEHEAAHRPPGSPRVHTREVVLERAARAGLAAILTSATPSVETWWRAGEGQIRADTPGPAPWPPVTIADSRGIARREALTPPLARAIRETLAAGRRVFLVVSRLTSALGCDECGVIVRCPTCAIALAHSPAARTLTCGLCSRALPPMDTCAACGGRRLLPFGWGAERVEHAVRRRFVRARIVRHDPDATRGRQGEAQRTAALGAQIVVGTRGALRLFGPASLGLVGFVSPDQVLGLPDFRAAERTFALLWAAAERVRADGQVIVQSRNPTHYAVDAFVKQDLDAFYRPELEFRAELGYPPFRRIAIATVRATRAEETARLAERIGVALRGVRDLVAYPAIAGRRRTRRVVVKGGDGLPGQLTAALDALDPGAALRGRGIIDVEVDPVEWPS